MLSRKNLEILLLAIWCSIIFIFSNIPSLSSGLEQDFLMRKVAHMSEFAILALLIWFVVKRNEPGKIMSLLVVFFLALDYAILDEIHQLFVVGRSGKFMDVGIDCIGIVFTLLVLLFAQNKRTASRAVL